MDNVPEGSYATDPKDGCVRIKAFKQMVMALHEAGICVILDTVLNHTYQPRFLVTKKQPEREIFIKRNTRKTKECDSLCKNKS